MTITGKLYQQLKQYIEQTTSPLLIKLLINGLKVDMTYQQGQLQKITMIDQDNFEVDVTKAVRSSVDVPEKIQFIGLVKVRANVIHTFADFEKMNWNGEYLHHKELTKKGLLQQNNCEENKVRVIVSNVVDIDGLDSGSFHTEMESLEFLIKQGFHVVYHENIECSSEGIMRYYNTFQEYQRNEIGYSVLGLQILSANSYGCNDGFILPFSPDEAILTVENIYPEVNSSGKIEPVITIKVHDLAGERNVSLRLPTFSLIRSMDIRIGDQVLMSDVHSIIGVETKKRTGKEIPVINPEWCPICGTEIKNDTNYQYCINIDCGSKSTVNQEFRQPGIMGKTIVITGTLSIRRYDFRKLIEQAGGILAGTVTNQTDYLLIGAKGIGTTKYRKAQSLKVPIITEEQFRLMIK